MGRETYDHEPAAFCGQCGEEVIADYDGELWHKADLEKYEAETYSMRLERLPEPPNPPSFQEQKAHYLRTGEKLVNDEETMRFVQGHD